MAYFQAFDEIVAIKPAYGSEEIMTLDQAIGMQDDAVSKSSENVI